MVHFRMKIWNIWSAWLFTWILKETIALRDVELIVPSAVKIGDTVPLGCKWTLDAQETLYSVKWYRGRLEFFRFIPKEMPHARTFPQPGISVDLSKSGPQQVVVRDVGRSFAGKFRCEVSADAPSFHTEVRSAYIHAVELPESAPVIKAEKSWYAPGDLLRAECNAPPADPPANLTWYINGKEMRGKTKRLDVISLTPVYRPEATAAPPAAHDDANNVIFSPWKALAGIWETTQPSTPRAAQVRQRTLADVETTTELSIPSTTEAVRRIPSSTELTFVVKPESFERGRLRIACLARVHSIYTATAELLIEEERPQIASVLGTMDASSGPLASSLFTLIPIALVVIQQKNWLYLR